jgi:aminoglycoside phosphotransferase (APT) family kinase protein
MERCAAIVEALARFHAIWWDASRLGTSVGEWADAAATARYLKNLAEKFAQFTNRLGDNLPHARCRLYERLLDAAPRLLERYHTRCNLTIVHGDLHVLNSFLPRDGGDDVRFPDWDSWRIGAGSTDLAYMMAIHWYPDRRSRLERPLLDRYHAALTSHGVDGYDRYALEDRLPPVGVVAYHHTTASGCVIWWNNLERVFLAVDDLGCRDLVS